MSTQTLRPNATLHVGGWTASDTTLHGDTSDEDTATGASTSGFNNMWLELESYTLAAGERVARARIVGNASGSAQSRNLLKTVDDVVRAQLDMAAAPSTVVQSGAWTALATVLTQADIDGLRTQSWRLTGGVGVPVEIRELYVELDVWERTDAPTVAIDEESAGTVSTTDLPTVQTYAADLNDGTPGQWSRQVMFVKDADYGSWSTDDDVTAGYEAGTYEWADSNTAFSTPSTASGAPDSIQAGSPLANTDTYRAYVRYGKNNVAGATLWSEWGHAEFDLSLTLPAAPTLDVSVLQASGRNQIEVTPATLEHDSLVSIEVQRSIDAGAWRTVRGGTVSDGIAAANTTEVADWDVPRGVPVRYRARVVEYLNASGTTIASAWMVAAASVHPNDLSTWIYDVDTFALVTGGLPVIRPVTSTVSEQIAVHRPPGRVDGDGTPVSVTRSAGLTGGQWEIPIEARDDSSKAAIEALLRHTGTLLFKWADGTQTYLRRVSAQQTVGDLGATMPRRAWQVSAVQVGSGY